MRKVFQMANASNKHQILIFKENKASKIVHWVWQLRGHWWLYPGWGYEQKWAEEQ